ncbi:ATP-binding protein [Kiritimatiella glycovorans]|uniref:histidine kinase n=1 Tax=Kiritimatiella glycovorans TaxID=1307763 RepID=A0A0G3EFL3_9BACT|nr:ATP-binding protein [Kiritimatiella glycovorans]AKJ65256.1 PAS/PAC sensor hybrid histidine kinase [Kiritimatiella glycovorans]
MVGTLTRRLLLYQFLVALMAMLLIGAWVFLASPDGVEAGTGTAELRQWMQEGIPAVVFLRRGSLVLFTGAVVFAVTGAVSWFMLRQITAPVHELARVAGEVACGNWDTHADVEREDELGAMAEALNLMISQRREWERRIEESRRWFRLLFDRSPEPILVQDPAGRIREANPAACALCGRTAEQLVGRTLFDFVPVCERGAVARRFKEWFDGSLQWMEMKINNASGTSIAVEVSGTVIRHQGEEAVVLHMRDISMRKQAEEDMRTAKERAEKANRLQQDFLANMSHEVRTPMNALIGLTDMLERTELSEEQHEYVHLLQDSGQNLLDLFTDILELSKLQSGQVQIRREEVNLRETVCTVLAGFRERSAGKDVRLRWRYAEDMPEWFGCDSGALTLILRHLLQNAVKFTDSGEIAVSVDAAGGLPETSGKTAVQIRVKDTGIGIPARQREEIFHCFSQGDSSSTRAHGGAGIGLAICQQLAELMAGQIRLESREAEGSVFTVRLPLEPLTDVPGTSGVEPPASRLNG